MISPTDSSVMQPSKSHCEISAEKLLNMLATSKKQSVRDAVNR